MRLAGEAWIGGACGRRKVGFAESAKMTNFES